MGSSGEDGRPPSTLTVFLLVYYLLRDGRLPTEEELRQHWYWRLAYRLIGQ